jgi:MbtH protein
MVDEQDERSYLVVRNIHGQYSIWLEHKAIPTGWEAVGWSGLKQSCLDHIEEVWTDMTPSYVDPPATGDDPQ